ncbi:MAG TPA: hypothetical protein VE175_13710, partial [Woeseiaceae bacterium]|nr:hypothetical protein [Woeseiaceae bacterium]
MGTNVVQFSPGAGDCRWAARHQRSAKNNLGDVTSMTGLDWFVIFLYFLLIAFIAWWYGRR